MNYGFHDLERDQDFNAKEESSIHNAIKPNQLPVVSMVKTAVKFDGKVVEKSAIALTKHFLYLFVQKQSGSAFEEICEIHIDSINTIGYNIERYKNNDIKQQNVLIMSTKHNIITNAPEVLRLAQMLYVFIQLSYPSNTNKRSQQSKKKVTIACDDMQLFPDLSSIPISPSQRFQFTYLAKCAKGNIQYNQEIVNYVHNLLISKNSLVDLSQLPADFALGTKDAAEVIDIVFETLGELGYVSGICCANINNPSIFKALVRLLEVGASFSIVHLENCNATTGIKDIFESRARSTPNFNVAYWNLKGNRLTDLNYLPAVLALNQRGLDCLNLSDTGLSHQNLIDLFTELSKNERLMPLRHLFLSGAPLNTRETLDAFSGWLHAAADLDLLRLETLDVSNIPEGKAKPIDAIIATILARPPPLRVLDVSRNRLGRRAQNGLCELARTSQTLTLLDISDTQLTSGDAYEIAECVASNPYIKEFTFRMCGLGVHGETFLEMFKFMASDKAKWTGFALDRSKMDAEDAKTLGSFLKRMPSTRFLSLNGNFDRSMKGIGEALPGLVRGRIQLRSLSIAGDEGHRLGEELIPLLEEIQKCEHIEELDISGNAAGDAALPYIAAVIRGCPNLRSLKIDGNRFTDARALQDVVDAIGQNTNIESCPFPVTDGKKAAEKLKNQKDRESFVDALAGMQMEAVKAVNCNRSAKGLPNELPFEVTPELHDLIDELSAECRRRTRGRKLMTHTLACELLGVPLPFQPRGAFVEPDRVEEVNDDTLDIYEEECLKKYTVEDREAYPGVIFTTVNPDIRSVIGGLPPPVGGVPPKSPSPSSDEEKPKPEPKPEPEKKPKHKPKAKPMLKRKKVVFSDSSDSSDDFNIKSKKKKTKSKRPPIIPLSSESDDNDDEEEFALRTRHLQNVRGGDSDSSESSEREGRARNAPKIHRKEIEDPDDLPAPPQKPKSQRKPRFTNIDFSGSDTEVLYKPSPKPRPKSNPHTPNEPNTPPKKQPTPIPPKKKSLPPPTNDLMTIQFNPIKPKPIKKAVPPPSSSSDSDIEVYKPPIRKDDQKFRSRDGFQRTPPKPMPKIAQRMNFDEGEPVVIPRTRPVNLDIGSSDSDNVFSPPPRPAPVRKVPAKRKMNGNWNDF